MKHDSFERRSERSQQVLDQQISAFLEENGTTNVSRLYSELSRSDTSLSEADVANSIKRLLAAGQIVEEFTPAEVSFGRFLKRWETCIGLYLATMLSFSILLCIYVIPADSPILTLRWILGAIFLIFVPGYVTVEAIFPKSRELNRIERLALSAGLSLALVSSIGLMLSYTPLGLNLVFVLTILVVFTLSMTSLGLMRRYRTFISSSVLAGGNGKFQFEDESHT